MKIADGVLIIFDLTKKEGFLELDNYIAEIDKYFFLLNSIILAYFKWYNRICKSNTCVYLIGNKNDLEGERQVGFTEAREFAEKKNIKYFETSAQNNEELESVMNFMITDVLNKLFTKWTWN